MTDSDPPIDPDPGGDGGLAIDLDGSDDASRDGDADRPSTSQGNRSDSPSGTRGCYRCGDLLDRMHWIRLTTQHRGSHVDAFADTTRAICPDCAAAVGVLDYVIEANGRISAGD